MKSTRKYKSVGKYSWIGSHLQCLHLNPVDSDIQFSRSVVSDSLQPHEPQHPRPPYPSPTARVYPNLCPLSWWCHSAISSSVVPFSSYPQSFPALGSFPMSWLFVSGDFPDGSNGKTSAYNVGDLGSILGLGRSSGEGNGNPLQYSSLENPMDRGAW